MNLNDIYQEIRHRLVEFGVETPDLEAKRLIEGVTGFNSTDFIVNRDKMIADEYIETVNTVLLRRLAGEPLSKIFGVREFWGLEFSVNQHTLDPRPDTETLIEAVLRWVDKSGRHGDELKILDLGTGTGCIPIALLSELPKASAVGVDISCDALDVAKENVEKHKMSNRLELKQGDWFEGVLEEEFDIFVSNPPYIPNLDIENLSTEVKNHDPILALSGGENGLDCYKKILFSLKNKLNGRNRAFLEIGIGQLESLSRLVDESKLLLCDSHTDLLGIPRVVEICCGDK